MAKREIGFTHGVSENPERTWEKQINGRAFTFKKFRVKEGIFLYNCKCHSESNRWIAASSAGFHSDRDLTPEQIEQLPQFADFISGHI